MQAIRLDLFNELFNKDLTSREIDFLLYLTLKQDRTGYVPGVYYKDVMEHTGMCKTSFYEALYSLEKKEIISYKRIQDDYDITFIGNDFSMFTKDDYKEGRVKYISTSRKLFFYCKDKAKKSTDTTSVPESGTDEEEKKCQPDFRSLSAKEKLFVMRLFNINMAGEKYDKPFIICKNNFYETYGKLLNVTRRTLQRFLGIIKEKGFFYVELKEGKYYITLKSNLGMENSPKSGKTKSYQATEQLVEVALRRNKLKQSYYNDKEKKEITDYINRGLGAFKKNGTAKVTRVPVTQLIKDMLEKDSYNSKHEKRLNVNLFKMLFQQNFFSKVKEYFDNSEVFKMKYMETMLDADTQLPYEKFILNNIPA